MLPLLTWFESLIHMDCSALCPDRIPCPFMQAWRAFHSGRTHCSLPTRKVHPIFIGCRGAWLSHKKISHRGGFVNFFQFLFLIPFAGDPISAHFPHRSALLRLWAFHFARTHRPLLSRKKNAAKTYALRHFKLYMPKGNNIFLDFLKESKIHELLQIHSYANRRPLHQ